MGQCPDPKVEAEGEVNFQTIPKHAHTHTRAHTHKRAHTNTHTLTHTGTDGTDRLKSTNKTEEIFVKEN